MHEAAVHRVLMTGDTVGGVWTFTLELAEALGADGVEVFLATMGGDPTREQRAAAAAIPNLHLLTSRYKLEWMDDPWLDVEESGRWLLELEKQVAPDVVHLNNYGCGTLPWSTPLVLTAHSCVLSWWAAVKRDRLPPRWSRYRREVECSLKAADLLLAPTAAMLRTVKENYGVDLATCRVAPNGRSSARFRAVSKEPILLTAGRLWDEAKNIAAVAQVAAKLPWPVYLAGEERHPNGNSVAAPGCRMLGSLSQSALAEWYGRAAVYVLPARYEPFGLSALEAALSGCALVLGDIASLREVWADAAVFVPPDDAGSLEAALRELIASPALLRETARRCEARAREFSPERMARCYLDAYRSVGGTRRSACAS
jgi:glycogen synthase